MALIGYVCKGSLSTKLAGGLFLLVALALIWKAAWCTVGDHGPAFFKHTSAISVVAQTAETCMSLDKDFVPKHCF